VRKTCATRATQFLQCQSSAVPVMVKPIITSRVIMEGLGAVNLWFCFLFIFDCLAVWTGNNPLEGILPWTPVMAQHAIWAFLTNVVTMMESDFDYPILRKFGPFFMGLKGTISKRCPCFASIWSVCLTSLYFGIGGITRLPLSRIWYMWTGVILVSYFFQILNILRLLCCCHRWEANEVAEVAAKEEKKTN